MTRWRLSRAEILGIIAFWLAVGTVTAFNRLFDPRPMWPRGAPPGAAVTLAYAEAVLWMILTPLVFWIGSLGSNVRVSLVLRVLGVAIAGLVIAVFVGQVLDYLRIDVLRIPRRRQVGMAPLISLRLSFLNHLMVYLAVLAAGFARENWHRARQRQLEAERLTTHAAQLQAQLAQARLETLRMQINPHFLFNTLHAISALVDRDAAGVRRMVARLSELLRYTLDSPAGEQVPLEREIAFMRRYLEIMEIRFQGRLEVTLEIDPGVERALVPSLILQPLVENAMKHGASRVRGMATVELTARRAGDRLVLTVRDNGPGPEAAPTESGIGLANVRERLDALYGSDASLSLASDDAGTRAEIAIPFIEREET